MHINGIEDFIKDVERFSPENNALVKYFKSRSIRGSRTNRSDLKRAVVIVLAIFVVGWVITFPKQNYWVFSGGNKSEKVILVSARMSSTPCLLIAPVWDIYSHLHWKQPVNIWEYDVNTRKLEKKNWGITIENLSPFSRAFQPVYSPQTKSFIVTTHNYDTKVTNIRALNEFGGIDYENRIKGSVFNILPSPNGEKLAVCGSQSFKDYACIIDLMKKEKKSLKLPEGAWSNFCHGSKWINNSELLVYFRGDIAGKGRDKGMYAVNIDTGAIDFRSSFGNLGFAVADYNKSFSFIGSGPSEKDKASYVYNYSMDDGALIRRFNIGKEIHGYRIFPAKNQVVVVEHSDIEKSDEDKPGHVEAKEFISSIIGDVMDSMYLYVYLGAIQYYDISVATYTWDGRQSKSYVMKNKNYHFYEIEMASDKYLAVQYSHKGISFLPFAIVSQYRFGAALLNIETGEQISVEDIIKNAEKQGLSN